MTVSDNIAPLELIAVKLHLFLFFDHLVLITDQDGSTSIRRILKYPSRQSNRPRHAADHFYLDSVPNCTSIPSYAFLGNHRHTHRYKSTELTWVWLSALAVAKHIVELCCTAMCFCVQSGRLTDQQSALFIGRQCVVSTSYLSGVPVSLY
jgi:hypothetical protein